MDDLLQTYYDLSKIFNDDVEVFAEAIQDITKRKESKSQIVEHLLANRLHKLEDELNYLYEDVPMHELKAYANKRQVKSLFEDEENG